MTGSDPDVAIDSNIALGRRIREGRKALGWSQATLAEAVGVKQTAVSQWEQGSTRPEPEKLSRIANLLQKTVSYLGFGEEPAQAERVPIIGSIGAGGLVTLEKPETQDGLEEIELPFHIGPGFKGLVARGDFNLPEVADGYVIVFRDVPTFDSDRCIDQRCVVRLRDGSMFVKTLKRGSRYGKFTLQSIGASDMAEVEVEWAAPVFATVNPRAL